MSSDLLIVGPGVLGSFAGKLWLEAHPGSRVVGQTTSETNHERLRKLGLEPTLKPEGEAEKFANVLFSAPPAGNKDAYVSDVKAAIACWTGEGSFVFTGSNSVIANEGEADEETPAVPIGQSDRTDTLLLSEQAVLEAGGTVIRYVGLYHATRGAHAHFLKMGTVKRAGSYVVNLIHYEDAASLAVAVLSAQGDGAHRGKVYIGCDNNPLSFQDMMDATFACGKFAGSCEFTGEGGDPGKKVNNSKTRAAVKWEPKYGSFVAFMKGGADDFYATSGLF